MSHKKLKKRLDRSMKLIMLTISLLAIAGLFA